MDELTQASENATGESSSTEKVPRKQWTREQKFEFIELFKKHNNKSIAARVFKSKHNYELNSKTYNR